MPQLVATHPGWSGLFVQLPATAARAQGSVLIHSVPQLVATHPGGTGLFVRLPATAEPLLRPALLFSVSHLAAYCLVSGWRFHQHAEIYLSILLLIRLVELSG